MKVLAFNCSPKKEKANTALILKPFLQGLEKAGAEVELFYTQKLKIKHCQGDLACWFKQPGVCIQKDDMVALYPKLREADIWVFATPVYFDGVSGPMKNLMDRLVPLITPFVELREGHCRHVLRPGTKPGKVVLVSNCGFWEQDNFEALLVHMRAFVKNVGREFAGALVRPCGESFNGLLSMQAPVQDILQAAEQAGYQLGTAGIIAPEILENIAREILPLEKFIKVSNRIVQEMLDKKSG